jgi:hypothetical protein
MATFVLTIASALHDLAQVVGADDGSILALTQECDRLTFRRDRQMSKPTTYYLA